MTLWILNICFFRASPKTVLTFCTHGVLLRTIFADPSLLNATTHIIVDELDETDLFTRKLTDNGQEIQLSMSLDTRKHTCNLLLGILQRILPRYSHLKLILVVNLNADSVVSPDAHFPSTSANHEVRFLTFSGQPVHLNKTLFIF